MSRPGTPTTAPLPRTCARYRRLGAADEFAGSASRGAQIIRFFALAGALDTSQAMGCQALTTKTRPVLRPAGGWRPGAHCRGFAPGGLARITAPPRAPRHPRGVSPAEPRPARAEWTCRARKLGRRRV